MTIALPLWLQNAGATAYTAAMWRAHLTAGMGQGVITPADWVVSEHAAGANMSVDIAAGSGAILGTEAAGQGMYLCSSDAVETVTIAASPSSGQSRVDLIVATVRDSSISGANNDMIFQVVTGTASSGTPVVPTVPASSVLLATVAVAGLVGTIGNGDITDTRTLAQQGTAPVATLSIPGSPGDILGKTDGTAWIAGADGSWSAIRIPKVQFASVNASNTNFGGGTWLGWSGGEVSIPATGFPCRVRGHFQCYFRGGSGLSTLQMRVGLSSNGGSSYSLSPSLSIVSLTTTDYKSVCMEFNITSSGSGGLKIQPQGNCADSGGASMTGGYVTLTATPT